MKIALNLDLTLPDDGECPALLISCGIIDLGAFCVELWSFFASKRISVPMSYNSLWEHGKSRKKAQDRAAARDEPGKERTYSETLLSTRHIFDPP